MEMFCVLIVVVATQLHAFVYTHRTEHQNTFEHMFFKKKIEKNLKFSQMPERTLNPKQTNKTPLAVRLENQDKLRTLDKKDTPGESFVLPFILTNFCRKSFPLKKKSNLRTSDKRGKKKNCKC